jgi:hypothetical protein
VGPGTRAGSCRPGDSRRNHRLRRQDKRVYQGFSQGSGFHGTRFNVEVEGVPDRLTVELHGERFPILFLVRGCPRVCFICSCTGHSQNECPESVCKYCNQKGHLINSCERKKKTTPRPKRPLRPGRRNRRALVVALRVMGEAPVVPPPNGVKTGVSSGGAPPPKEHL